MTAPAHPVVFRPIIHAVVGLLLDDHVARRADHSRQLWGLMSFSLWCDGATRAPAPSRG